MPLTFRKCFCRLCAGEGNPVSKFIRARHLRSYGSFYDGESDSETEVRSLSANEASENVEIPDEVSNVTSFKVEKTSARAKYIRRGIVTIIGIGIIHGTSLQ